MSVVPTYECPWKLYIYIYLYLYYLWVIVSIYIWCRSFNHACTSLGKRWTRLVLWMMPIWHHLEHHLLRQLLYIFPASPEWFDRAASHQQSFSWDATFSAWRCRRWNGHVLLALLWHYGYIWIEPGNLNYNVNHVIKIVFTDRGVCQDLRRLWWIHCPLGMTATKLFCRAAPGP